jgi:hypothetical protein
LWAEHAGPITPPLEVVARMRRSAIRGSLKSRIKLRSIRAALAGWKKKFRRQNLDWLGTKPDAGACVGSGLNHREEEP